MAFPIRDRLGKAALVSTLAMFTMLLCTFASAGIAHADETLLDFPSLTLDEAEMSQALGEPVTMMDESAITKDQIFSMDDREVLDSGANPELLRKAEESLRQVWNRDFITDSEDYQVRVRLFEFDNHAWATAMMGTTNYVLGPGYPPETVLNRWEGEAGGARVEARMSDGRVMAAVTAQTGIGDPTVEGDAATFEALDAVASSILNAQLAALPPTSDLTDDNPTDLSDARIRLGIAITAVVPVLGLGYAFANSLRDRGTRERFRIVNGARGGRPEFVDLDPAARRRRLSLLIRNLVRITIITAWVAASYFLTGAVSVIWLIGIMAIGLGVISGLEMWLAGRGARGSAVGSGFGRLAWAGMAGSLVVYGLAACLLVAAATGFAVYDRGFAWLVAAGLALLGLRLLAATAAPLRLSKRLAAPSVDKVLAADPRPEVMLLRSFQDDSLEMRVHRGARHSQIEAASTESHERFEELLAWSLWEYGPVAAIGQPGTVLQPLGAAREYHSDDTWQEAVREHIRNSVLVVFVVGRSPGLMWEVQTVRGEGALAKALFLFPPESSTEINRRLTVLAAALDLDPGLLPIQGRMEARIVGMYFDEGGRPIFMTVTGRDDLAYQAAVEHAGAELVGRGPVVLHDPAVECFQARNDPGDLLVTFDPSARRPKRVKAVKFLLDRVLDQI